MPRSGLCQVHGQVYSTPRSVPCQGKFHGQSQFHTRINWTPWSDTQQFRLCKSIKMLRYAPHLLKIFKTKVISTPRSVPRQGHFHPMSFPRQGHFHAKVRLFPWQGHLLLRLGMPQDLVNKMSVTCQGQFHAKVSSKPRSVPSQGQLHAMISETQGSSH